MGSVVAQLVPAMKPFLQPARHKVAHGGRGGGKSHSIGTLALLRGADQPLRILCAREIQKSLKDSVHKLLSDKIKELGLTAFYRVTKEGIYGRNGTEFIFSGLQDHTADTIKSYEGVDLTWVEEAHKITSRSANILIPTVLRRPGAEIMWSFNPDQKDDYVYQRFITEGDANAIVVQINWRDNPWFPAALNDERLRLKALNEDLYNHVWEGHCRSASGLLFKRHWFRWYTQLPQGDLSPYMASDYAGGPDPKNPDADPDFTEHGIAKLDAKGGLYLADWWYGQEDPETWISAAVNLIKRHDPKVWFEEKGPILRATDASIAKRLREHGIWIYREPLVSAGTKVDRALGFAARASAGAVWLPEGEAWAERLVNQLCAFSGEDGRRDDGVDVCSLFARGLDKMANGGAPEIEDDAPPQAMTLEWLRDLQHAQDQQAQPYG